jgi:hypothetical protein
MIRTTENGVVMGSREMEALDRRATEACEETRLAHEDADTPSVTNAASSCARQSGAAPDSGPGLDRLLSEIEDRITELKGMVTRFALVRSVQSSEEDSGPGNEAAVRWIHDALDDIGAAALGIELNSHEGLLRIKLAAMQDLMTKTVQVPDPGTEG